MPKICSKLKNFFFTKGHSIDITTKKKENIFLPIILRVGGKLNIKNLANFSLNLCYMVKKKLFLNTLQELDSKALRWDILLQKWPKDLR